jgi:hypothetical protein
LSAGLFLAWGMLNAALAIYVPYMPHTGGVTALGGLVLTPEADEALLGKTFSEINAQTRGSLPISSRSWTPAPR